MDSAGELTTARVSDRDGADVLKARLAAEREITRDNMVMRYGADRELTDRVAATRP